MRVKPFIMLNQITVLFKRAGVLGCHHPLGTSSMVSSCTSLVPYGTNLSSTVSIKLSPLSLRQFNLPSNYQSIVVGKLLSDAWLEKSSPTSNTRLGFKQSIIHSEYVINSFMILSHYCSNKPIFRVNKLKGKKYNSLEFRTRYLPCFNELHGLFYKNEGNQSGT